MSVFVKNFLCITKCDIYQPFTEEGIFICPQFGKNSFPNKVESLFAKEMTNTLKISIFRCKKFETLFSGQKNKTVHQSKMVYLSLTKCLAIFLLYYLCDLRQKIK